MEKEATEVINEVVQVDDFKWYAENFSVFSNAAGIRYARWFFLQVNAGHELRHLYNELIRNRCDVVGVCLLPGGKHCAVSRRTQVKKILDIQGVEGGIKYYTVKTKGCNPKNMNIVVVSIMKAWDKIGTNYIKNYKIEIPTDVSSWQLYREWESLTVEQINWEIIEATEKVRLKRPHSPRDELVSKMGRDLLRRKKESMVSGSSFKRFGDDPTIIPLCEYINLDQIVCRTPGTRELEN